MRKLRTLSLSVSLLAGTAVLAEDRPAVRMLPAKPFDAVETVTARAAAGGFDPFQSAPPPKTDDAKTRRLFDSVKKADEPTGEPSNWQKFTKWMDDRAKAVKKADEPTSEPSNWQKFTKWMDDRAKAVKKALDSPPSDQPPPRVAPTTSPPPPQQPIRKFFEGKKDTPPDVPKVNAANPAYRWYGWGSTTPGTNSYAPTGDYPMGSSQWYVQTGATPGAFPTPTMNPYRPVPGSEPPTYIPPPQPIAAPTPVPSPAAVPFTPPPPVISRKTIAETPRIPQPTPAPAPPPPIPAPTIPTAPKIDPAWKPAAASEIKPAESTWKPAENAIIPVIRGQQPMLDDSPLSKRIQETCRGLVTNVAIHETGPGQLTIHFTANTAALAEITIKAISAIPELKPFSVEFAGKVNQ